MPSHKKHIHHLDIIFQAQDHVKHLHQTRIAMDRYRPLRDSSVNQGPTVGTSAHFQGMCVVREND